MVLRTFVSGALGRIVLMPETAADVYYGFIFRQNNIRLTGQAFYVQSVSESVFMQKRANPHFRDCIFAFYASHRCASLGLS